MHVDTWRAAYGGIVPEDHLAGLSYDESERMWHEVIEAGDGCVFVAEDELGGVFGFASGRRRERIPKELEAFGGELMTVYVIPSGQGSGAGGRLVGAVARYFANAGVGSMLLWVFEDNGPARRFYESLGGAVVARDGFELGGVWVREVAYGWRDLGVLLKRAGED